MKSLNKVQLIGNLGVDPELSTGKIPNVSFSIATTESWFDKATQSTKENTTWHKIVIFNEYLKEMAMKHLKKGYKIFVEGQLSKSTYKDKNGAEQTSWSITLPSFKGDIILLSDKGSTVTADKPQSTYNPNSKYAQHKNFDLNDDLPF